MKLKKRYKKAFLNKFKIILSSYLAFSAKYPGQTFRHIYLTYNNNQISLGNYYIEYNFVDDYCFSYKRKSILMYNFLKNFLKKECYSFNKISPVNSYVKLF